MSDGPHKSLNMRRGWKRLAERAANAAFDVREVVVALVAAIERDFRDEVPLRFIQLLRSVLDDHQGALFAESVTEQLHALRPETAGHPLAGMVLDCAVRAVQQGLRGREALERAVANALRERAVSGRRQVEEHWLRARSARSVGSVGRRIDDAIAALDMAALARRLVGCSAEDAPGARGKLTGIDDGVSLS